MSEQLPDHVLMSEITPELERLYDRHMENARLWEPFEHVPFSMGEDFDKQPWHTDQYPLNDAVRSAVHINLLTEDNLPYYYEVINELTPRGQDHVWGVWAKQWTMEEARHSEVIRSWAHTTRAIDPRMLEEARRPQMAGGVVPHPETLADALVYTTLQEKATQVAHRNTGRLLGDERRGSEVMGLVAGDETLHHNFYRDAAVAAMEVDPSSVIIALRNQIKHFAMPGTGIPRFKRHAIRIARAGIYDEGHFKENVVDPSIRHFDYENTGALTEEAKAAQAELVEFLPVLQEQAEKAKARRQAA